MRSRICTPWRDARAAAQGRRISARLELSAWPPTRGRAWHLTRRGVPPLNACRTFTDEGRTSTVTVPGRRARIGFDAPRRLPRWKMAARTTPARAQSRPVPVAGSLSC